MFTRISFALGILCLLLSACNKRKVNEAFYTEENAKVFEEKVTLEGNEEKVFIMDSTLWLKPSSIQSFIQDGIRYISIFDPVEVTLHTYEYESSQKVQTIKFELEGPNGLGWKTENMGHFMLSKDTILLHHYWENRLLTFTSKGEKLNVIQLPLPDKQPLSIFIESSSAFKVQNFIYFPNLHAGFFGDKLLEVEKVPAFIALNLSNKQITSKYTRSPVYEIGHNSIGDNTFVYGTYNPKTEKVVYSFRQDHFVYETGVNGQPEKHYVGSKFFEEIPPFNYDWEEGVRASKNRESVRRYISTSPKYDALFYDEWRDVYYRFAYLPKSIEEYTRDKFRLKPTVIIFDSKFKKIGEHLLAPDAFYFGKLSSSFVTEDGLLIPWKNEIEGNLIFKVFKLVAKEGEIE